MKTTSGPESVCRQRLNRFAIATLLATAGLLAFAWPANAEVVYTRTNVSIDTGMLTYELDLNNDGITDVTIQLEVGSFVCTKFPPCSAETYTFLEFPASGNGVLGKPPAALKKGAQIGPDQTFFAGDGTMSYLAVAGRTCEYCGSHSGNWYLTPTGYLGMEFQIQGETHYGWARFSLVQEGKALTLTGYAYETVAGMPINAGQTK